jgi:Cu/Ag efflux protein CusF
MLRASVAALAVLVLCVGGAFADEIKGKIKSVDAEKKTVTVTVDGKDQTLECAEKCEVLRGTRAVADGLKALKEGQNVTITCEKKGDKACATKIVIGRPAGGGGN